MSPAANTKKHPVMPVVYIPHGGGPLPLMGEPQHHGLIEFLKDLPKQLPAPKAILMISAHWESNIAAVSSSASPEMIYDYGGFPPETYAYQYPAPGNPALAQTICSLFTAQQIDCRLDQHRGFDHGTFVPLMLMYPNANIPVVQVSLLRSLDPTQHIALGQALVSLREQGVLIVGSGMSFHNSGGSVEGSTHFDNWLTDTLVSCSMSETRQRLIDWQSAPGARESHRREEHLLPLHVCLGAASHHSSTARKVFSGSLFKRPIAAFSWH